MSKETIVFILGALVFLSPYMGFPREYKEWFFIVSGVFLMAIGYRLRRLAFLRSLEDGSGRRRADDVFVESTVPQTDLTEPQRKESHI